MSLPESYNPFQKQFDDIESDDLETLRNVHEGWYVDYKEAPLNARGNAKAISAMANTYGGWIFIGVAEASKNDNVAGSFPGIATENLDACCQGLRQAVAEHLNPQPFFKLKTLPAPSATNEEQVVCVYVPPSPKAPIIHSDGRIYRRVNDSSEPVAENDRQVVEHLFTRTKTFKAAYADWFKRNPELSKAEDNVTYLRVIAVTDYWNENNLWLSGDVEAFRETLRAKEAGIFFSQPFDSVYSLMDGFVARATQPDDARMITSTFILRRELHGEFILPIPSYRVDQYTSIQPNRPQLAEAMEFLSRHGHHDSTILDLSEIFGPLDGFFTLMRRFQKNAGYAGKTHVKFKVRNAWRRIPVLALSSDGHGWDDYGVPMVLTDNVSSLKGGDINTFYEMDLHQRDGDDNDGFLLALPLFSHICSGLGLNSGSLETFSKRVSDAVMSAYNNANKIAPEN
jgi:hypothetical protein